MVRSSWSNKNHLAVLLLATTCAQIPPPMIIFRGKIDEIINNLIIPLGFIVKAYEKLLMDDDLMKICVEEIWPKHTQAEYKRPGFQNSILSFDAFTAHLTEGIKNQLLTGSSNILAVLPGCTSKCQTHEYLPKQAV